MASVLREVHGPRLTFGGQSPVGWLPPVYLRYLSALNDRRRAHMRGFLLLAILACQPSASLAQNPDSLIELQRRATADSNDPSAHYNLAMAEWDRKDWDAAEASLRTAVRIAPAYADAYLALSALVSARGEKHWKQIARERGDSVVRLALRESFAFYRRAFLLNPLVNLRPLGRYSGPDLRIAPRWFQEFKKGVTNLYRGDYAEAYRQLDRAVSESERVGVTPDVLLWHRALAAAHVDSFDVAAGDFRELTTRAATTEQQHPDRVSPLLANDYRFFLSTMLYLGGYFNEAVAGYRQVLENDLSLYVAHVELARMYEASDMWDEAIAERRRALDANPDDPGLMVELAATLLRRGHRDDALPLLGRAGELNARDARVPYLLGEAAIEAGDDDEARRQLTRFLSIAPRGYTPQIASVRSQLEGLK